jgi:pimeloyl-ACP methyl ester carboxylesterase
MKEKKDNHHPKDFKPGQRGPLSSSQFGRVAWGYQGGRLNILRWVSRFIVRASGIVAFALCTTTATLAASVDLELFDVTGARRLPLVIYQPSESSCSSRCPVAIFGTGYQIGAREYSFLGNALAAAGYLVVVVQHDLPDDAPMPNTGNITNDRTPFWRRGVASLQFLLRELPQSFPAYDWDSVIASGHSQGGDIVSMFASDHPDRVSALITLDNRRVPLPNLASFPILSLRSSDQPPDPGVLPSTNTKSCILKMSDTLHDDMTDVGSPTSKATMANAVLRFLKEQECHL